MSFSTGHKTIKITKIALSGEKPRCRFCDACLDLQNLRNSIKKTRPELLRGGL
jgi:hypothetical protein